MMKVTNNQHHLKLNGTKIEPIDVIKPMDFRFFSIPPAAKSDHVDILQIQASKSM